MNSTWTAVAAVAAGPQTVILLVAALYGASQINEVKRSRQLSVLLALFTQLDSTEVRRIRHALFNDLPDLPLLRQAVRVLRLRRALLRGQLTRNHRQESVDCDSGDLRCTGRDRLRDRL